MGTCYAHLDLEERQKLARWREAKLPMKEIALRLGRAPSTLYREMQRNRFVDDEIPELSGYYGMTAQRAYEKRRAIHRKLVRHPAMKAAVVDRLKAGWSPEQIAGRMKLEGHATSVSHETIYLYGRTRQPLHDLDEGRRPDLQARHGSLIYGLKALPQPARRSITFDRATEFTAWAHLKAGLGVAQWFGDPQSP